MTLLEDIMKGCIKYCTVCSLIFNGYCSNIYQSDEIKKIKTESRNALFLSVLAYSKLSSNSTATPPVNSSVPPSVRIRKNSTTSTASGNYTNISFDTVVYDTGNFFSLSSPDKLTVGTAGQYYLNGQLSYASNGTGLRKTNIVLNDTSVIASSIVTAVTSDNTNLSAETVYTFSAGDFLRLQGYQNSGSTINIQLNSGYSQILSIIKVSN